MEHNIGVTPTISPVMVLSSKCTASQEHFFQQKPTQGGKQAVFMGIHNLKL